MTAGYAFRRATTRRARSRDVTLLHSRAMTPPALHSPQELLAFETEAVRHVRDVAHELVAPSLGRADDEHRWATETQVHTTHDAVAGEAFAQRFSASFPDHGLIVEDRESIGADRRAVWHVDPIDGSANHLRGIPYVAVTVGLLVDGVATVGVVHDVVRDITLSATSGQGARRIDATGEASPMPRLDDDVALRDAMLIAHLSKRGPLLGREGALQALLWEVRKIRCMGSIALDLALLAAGEADLLVVGRGTHQRMLDIVGGLVVLEESGGRVCTTSGGPIASHTRTLVAGRPGLCDELVAVMDRFDLEAWTASDAVDPR